MKTRYARLALVLLVVAAGLNAAEKPQPPFRYVPGKAYHIMPGTHNQESGYFSLCEGLDGKVYVGAAKYGENSYLIEFDPQTEEQRIVIDVHKLCGLDAKGYAAQAKIHTRNFVGPSGKVYVGSKQGYRFDKNDRSEYPGGYLMVYDPKAGKAENLGMPYPGQGIIDVVADEERGLIYVVTCEKQHWMVYDVKTKKYRELGPLLVSYATTLVDRRGRANVVTRDAMLAQYDPATGKVTVRPIAVDGQKRTDPFAVPTWNLAADGKTAYLIQMSDATLFEIDLLSEGESVQARTHGKMTEGKNPDSRGALSIGPDGCVYAVIRIDNDTGFGTGFLHHLVKFDPKAGKTVDLGVLTVRNPDFFDFTQKAPWSHGYHVLPDGTLTPLHSHMAMIVAHDGTVYVTIIYPFTLLRVPGVCAASPAP